MDEFENYLKKRYRWIIFLISVFFLIVSISNAKNDSVTFDEVAHIPAGYSYLTEHDMRLNPEHPPLIKELSALPLLFMDLKFDTTQKFWVTDVNGQWDAGKNLLYEMGNDSNAIYFWARIPIVLLSFILGLFIFKWTKEIAGTIAGLVAFSLYSFDPNILGHNHFVTTDIGIAAFVTFAFYYFIKFLKNPSYKNAFIGGVFLGLLQLAKFSSIVTFPVLGLGLFAYSFFINASLKERFQNFFSYLLKGFVAFLVSIITVWLLYFFSTYQMPQENLTKTIDFYFSPSNSELKNELTRNTLIYLNQYDLTRPLSEYMLGIGMVFKRVAGGNSVYYFQQVSEDSFLSYFPTVFILKETIPFLLLIAITLTISAFQIIKSALKKETWNEKMVSFRNYIHNNPHIYLPTLFIVLYSYLSITGNLNIGLRHLFPIFPFIFLLIGFIILERINNTYPNDGLSLKTGLYTLIFLIFIEAVIVCPFYLSYFNQFAGGPKNGYRYVTDSNADWGQDLNRLKRFLDKHPEIDKIRVDYFGGGNPKLVLGDKYLQWWDSKRPIENGWYAVSTNFLQGSIYDTRKKDEDSWRWVQKYQPKYQVGTSIFIYEITDQK